MVSDILSLMLNIAILITMITVLYISIKTKKIRDKKKIDLVIFCIMFYIVSIIDLYIIPIESIRDFFYAHLTMIMGS